MFQVGRQIFIRMMGLEYVTPSRGGSNDLLEGIKPQWADFIMFGVLFVSIIAAQEF